MKVVDTIADLREARAQLQGRVGLVPTMGALHEGHMSLVKAAREDCDKVVVTIFVNPTQFGPNEDLDAYPRDLPGDLAKLEGVGVDLVFTPTPEIMYPADYQTFVEVEKVSQGKEVAHRPGHFRGVATIVTKLFNLTQPNVAYFGQKDAQQVAVIKALVRDLNFPLDIVVIPIVREADGLAMSSRNVYLNPDERRAATALSRSLQAAAAAYEAGERDPERLRQAVLDVLNAEPLAHVDYVSVADAVTLEELSTPSENPILLSLTARVGLPRLLDNCLLPYSLNTREALTRTLGGTV
ncbi:MAG: pantoate--beta-alanine ligase [Chloroflexi bacterium]|nr:MAG: pantoate--beta-alanine ligase [Chloroflexota bacterium]